MTLDDTVSLRAAYQIMYVFAVRYWERGDRSDEMTNFIFNIALVLSDQTADPAQIHDWLDAAEHVLSKPDRPWTEPDM